MHASALTRFIPAQLDGLGRLAVDTALRVGSPSIFAAGDTAAAILEEDHLAMQNCQHAQAMGRIAGHNAVADLVHVAALKFDPDPYVTCLDLGGGGAVFTTGWTASTSSRRGRERHQAEDQPRHLSAGRQRGCDLGRGAPPWPGTRSDVSQRDGLGVALGISRRPVRAGEPPA